MGNGERSEPQVFEFSGGALCLDFVNTSEEGLLTGYADLLAWANQAGLLAPAMVEHLGRRARRHRGEAGAAFDRAAAFREDLYRIFSELASGGVPADPEIRRLNAVLAEALPNLGVVRDKQGFRWDWSDSTTPDRVLWAVARSAADLLTSPEIDQLRECASDTCRWLFVDRSRSRRRRWCDMKTCGNRHKARRHYARRKAARSPSS